MCASILTFCLLHLIGETENVCGLSSPTELVFAELCLSVNETIAVVDYGAAGWSLLIGN